MKASRVTSSKKAVTQNSTPYARPSTPNEETPIIAKNSSWVIIEALKTNPRRVIKSTIAGGLGGTAIALLGPTAAGAGAANWAYDNIFGANNCTKIEIPRADSQEAQKLEPPPYVGPQYKFSCPGNKTASIAQEADAASGSVWNQTLPTMVSAGVIGFTVGASIACYITSKNIVEESRQAEQATNERIINNSL